MSRASTFEFTKRVQHKEMGATAKDSQSKAKGPTEEKSIEQLLSEQYIKEESRKG